MIQYFPIVTGSLTVLGNINVSGSITTSGSITISGSITSASFASTASYWSGSIVNAESASFATSASNATNAISASYANNLTVAGTLTAQTLVVQTITSSVDFVTGSTKFGSLSSNTHVFTGSMYVTGALYVTTGSVGIGTTAPNFTLHIDSNTATTRFQITNSTTGQGGSVGFQLLQIANDTTLTNRSNGYMAFETVGTERMRITNGGNVLINTTTEVIPDTSSKMIKIGDRNIWQNVVGTQLLLSRNAYYSGSGWFNIVTGGATAIRMNDDPGDASITFFTTSSASAGTALTNWDTAGPKMTIRNSGNVGIGTTSPLAGLEVVTDSGAFNAMRLVSNRAYNLSTDVALTFRYKYDTANYTTGGLIVVAKDNNTISNESGNMQFYTNNAGLNAEKMRITSGGEVLIGRTTTFSTFGDSTGIVQYGAGTIYCAATSNEAMGLSRRTTDGIIILFRKDGTTVGSISTNANSLPSDKNFKKNINNLNLGLNIVSKLRPVSYNHKIDDEGTALSTGFIAQELEQSLTELGVEQNKYHILQNTPNEDETQSQYWLDYTKMIPVLTKAIQELNTKFEEYKATHP